MGRFLEALGAFFDGRFHLRYGEVNHEWSDILDEAITRYGIKKDPTSVLNYRVIVGPFTVWMGGRDMMPYATGRLDRPYRHYSGVPRRKVALRLMKAYDELFPKSTESAVSKERRLLDEYIAENP